MEQITLETIQGQLKDIADGVGARVAQLEADGKATTEEKASMKSKLETVETELAEINKQIKGSKKFAMPGVTDGKEPFSLQMYYQALHRRARGESEPWKYSGVEKEALDQLKTRAESQQVTDPEYGGYLVPDEVSTQIIDLAVADMPIMNMGATFFKGLHGDFRIPKTTARPTLYWLGERTKPTQSDAKLGNIWLRKKKSGAFVRVTKDLVYQSRGVADPWIKAQMATTVADGMHDVLINGTGSDHQPKGILNYPAEDFTATTEATNGARFSFDKAATMISNLMEANEVKDSSKLAFLTRPIVKMGLARQTVLQYSGQAAADGQPIIGGTAFLKPEQVDGMIGYPMKTTTHISKTLTKGSASERCSAVILGDWAQFAIGTWRAPELKVSAEAGDGSTGSAFLDDEFYIVMFNSIDCNFLRQTAFTVVKDADTNGL